MLKLVGVLLLFALAGCTGAVQREEVTVTITESEVPFNSNQQKLASCDGDAVLSYETGASEKGGQITIQVKEGGGYLVGSEEVQSNQSGSVDLNGGSGKWLLRVDRDGSFEGTFTVSLTC